MGLIACFIGHTPLYLYGCIVAAAIIAGLIVARISTWIYDEDFSTVVDMMLPGMLVGFLTARLGYVLGHWHLYAAHPGSILSVQEGGFSLYGAAFGLLLVLWLYSSRHEMSCWHWLDILAPALVLVVAIDQLGHFATQATVGMPLPSNLLEEHTLAEYIEFSYRPSGFENYEYFQPVALWQAGIQLVVFLVLMVLSFLQSQRRLWQEGCLFLVGTLLVALVRFGCGFFYLAVKPGLHPGQILSLVAAAVCLLLFWRRQHHRQERYFLR